MSGVAKKGFPLIGVIFLALALFRFLNGKDWVVWLILGILFGGLAAFGRKKSGDEA